MQKFHLLLNRTIKCIFQRKQKILSTFFFDNNHGILIKVTLQKKLQEIEEKKVKKCMEKTFIEATA